MQYILYRLEQSTPNEGSHELYCRCLDAAAEIYRLRAALLHIECEPINAEYMARKALSPNGQS